MGGTGSTPLKVLRFAVYWTPFMFIYLFYESFRSIVPLLVSSRRDATTPLRFEEALFGAPLFLILYHYRVFILDLVFSLIYALHPLYSVIYAVYLYFKERTEEYVWYAAVFTATSLLGLTIYILWPVAPPWMSPIAGVSRVPNYFSRLLSAIGLSSEIDPNPYAAMPSMHVGIAIIFSASLARLKPKHRIAAVLWPALMSVSVIYTGNHYLLDVIAGALVAYAGIKLGSRLYSRLDKWLRRLDEWVTTRITRGGLLGESLY